MKDVPCSLHHSPSFGPSLLRLLAGLTERRGGRGLPFYFDSSPSFSLAAAKEARKGGSPGEGQASLICTNGFFITLLSLKCLRRRLATVTAPRLAVEGGAVA